MIHNQSNMNRSEYLNKLISLYKGSYYNSFIDGIDYERKKIQTKAKKSSDEKFKYYTLNNIIDLLQGAEPVNTISSEDLENLSSYSEFIQSLELIVKDANGNEAPFLVTVYSNRFFEILKLSES